MKKYLLTILTGLFITTTIMAQEQHQYKVHIKGKNGMEVKEVFQNLQALASDERIQKLDIGVETDGKFDFRPDESKHTLYAVERLGGAEKYFIFQSWGESSTDDTTTAIVEAPEPPEAIAYSGVEKRSSDNVIAPPEPATIVAKEVVDELMKDQLVTDRSSIVIEFANGWLKINGVKQSEEIKKKYKALLGQNGIHFDDHFVYDFVER